MPSLREIANRITRKGKKASDGDAHHPAHDPFHDPSEVSQGPSDFASLNAARAKTAKVLEDARLRSPDTVSHPGNAPYSPDSIRSPGLSRNSAASPPQPARHSLVNPTLVNPQSPSQHAASAASASDVPRRSENYNRKANDIRRLARNNPNFNTLDLNSARERASESDNVSQAKHVSLWQKEEHFKSIMQNLVARRTDLGIIENRIKLFDGEHADPHARGAEEDKAKAIHSIIEQLKELANQSRKACLLDLDKAILEAEHAVAETTRIQGMKHKQRELASTSGDRTLIQEAAKDILHANAAASKAQSHLDMLKANRRDLANTYI